MYDDLLLSMPQILRSKREQLLKKQKKIKLEILQNLNLNYTSEVQSDKEISKYHTQLHTRFRTNFYTKLTQLSLER